VPRHFFRNLLARLDPSAFRTERDPPGFLQLPPEPAERCRQGCAPPI
jgi:hypothetical protein